MSGKASIVDNGGIERAVAKATITVDGAERKVVKIMQTIDGKWQNVFSSGTILKYTGETNLGTNTTFEFDEKIDLKLLTSGTLTMIDGDPVEIEVFLQGGGYNGSAGGSLTEWPSQWWYGGKGGDGGYHYNGTATIKPGDSFEIVIGGRAAATTGFGLSSRSGSYSVGGRRSFEGQSPTKGQDGVYAFNDPGYDGVRYGAAAGGAGYSRGYNGENATIYEGKPGGNDGGGHGATGINSDGFDGTGYGSGGGGSNGSGTPGYGKGGIMCIRSKEAA